MGAHGWAGGSGPPDGNTARKQEQSPLPYGKRTPDFWGAPNRGETPHNWACSPIQSNRPMLLMVLENHKKWHWGTVGLWKDRVEAIVSGLVEQAKNKLPSGRRLVSKSTCALSGLERDQEGTGCTASSDWTAAGSVPRVPPHSSWMPPWGEGHKGANRWERYAPENSPGAVSSEATERQGKGSDKGQWVTGTNKIKRFLLKKKKATSSSHLCVERHEGIQAVVTGPVDDKSHWGRQPHRKTETQRAGPHTCSALTRARPLQLTPGKVRACMCVVCACVCVRARGMCVRACVHVLCVCMHVHVSVRCTCMRYVCARACACMQYVCAYTCMGVRCT